MLVRAGWGARWSTLVTAIVMVTGGVTRTPRGSAMQAATASTATCLRNSNCVAGDAPHGHCDYQVNAQSARRQDSNGTCTYEYGYLRMDCSGESIGTARNICIFKTGGRGVYERGCIGTGLCTCKRPNASGLCSDPDCLECMEPYCGNNCSNWRQKYNHRGNHP